MNLVYPFLYRLSPTMSRRVIYERFERGSELDPFNNLSRVAASEIYKTLKKHYIFSLLWVLGILVCFFAKGYKPSSEALTRYHNKLATLDQSALYRAEDDLFRAKAAYYHSKGWFYCDAVCNYHYQVVTELEKKVSLLTKNYEHQLSAAKKEVGLFSEQGAEEARSLFWSYFGSGKKTAQRMTFYDFLFTGAFTLWNDEGLLSFILRMLLNVFINFTISLIGAFFAFIFSLWSLIRSYQPDLLSAFFFFLCCFLGSFAFVLTWIAGLLLGTSSVALGLGSIIIRNSRLERERYRPHVPYEEQNY